MATSTTVTTTKGNKTTSVTTNIEQPGKAWVANKDPKTKKKKPWIRPAKPKGKVPAGGYAWDDDEGWLDQKTAAAQLQAGNEYAYPLAIIQSDKELETLFNEAWLAQKKGQEWSKEKFKVRLQATKWYSDKEASERNYYVLANDPGQKAEFDSQVEDKKDEIITFARTNGITLSELEINNLTTDALRFGQTPEQLSSILVGYVNYQSSDVTKAAGSLFGKAGDAEDAIRNWAKSNGITVSDSFVLGKVREAGGTASSGAAWDISKAQDSINKMAKQQYTHWADQLDGTTTLDDLAAGFKNTISEEMDIDFGSLNMSNQLVKNAMLAKDDKNMPINSEALRKTLYKTNEWSNVLKNKDKIMGAGRDILTRMGF
jgi:hypothetical protein